jgi:hypothetical protein
MEGALLLQPRPLGPEVPGVGFQLLPVQVDQLLPLALVDAGDAGAGSRARGRGRDDAQAKVSNSKRGGRPGRKTTSARNEGSSRETPTYLVSLMMVSMSRTYSGCREDGALRGKVLLAPAAATAG